MIRLLHLIRYFLQPRRRPIKLSGHFDVQLGMAENCIIIDSHVAVSGQDQVIFRYDKGIDFCGPGIIPAGHSVQPGQDSGKLDQKLPGETGSPEEIADFEIPQSGQYIDGDLKYLIRLFTGNLFDSRPSD